MLCQFRTGKRWVLLPLGSGYCPAWHILTTPAWWMVTLIYHADDFIFGSSILICIVPSGVGVGMIPSDVVHLMYAEGHRVIVVMVVVWLRFIVATPFPSWFLGGGRRFRRRFQHFVPYQGPLHSGCPSELAFNFFLLYEILGKDIYDFVLTIFTYMNMKKVSKT